MGLQRLVVWAHKMWLFGPRGLETGKDILAAHRNVPFIFNISFHRCGTRSVHRYLVSLGKRGLHWPGLNRTGFDFETIASSVAHDRLQVLYALAPLLRRFEAFGDVPYPALYREISQELPAARFLLVTRPVEQWWQSVVRHKGLALRPGPLDPFEAIQYQFAPGTVVDLSWKERLSQRYINHLREAEQWFAGSDRLLAVELADPEVGKKISAFLQLEERPFPHYVGNEDAQKGSSLACPRLSG